MIRQVIRQFFYTHSRPLNYFRHAIAAASMFSAIYIYKNPNHVSNADILTRKYIVIIQHLYC